MTPATGGGAWLPDQLAERRFLGAIGAALLAHLLFAGALLLPGSRGRDEDPAPVRLVFVEPAPPPPAPLGDLGGEGDTPQMSLVPAAKADAVRPRPKVEARPKPVEKPVREVRKTPVLERRLAEKPRDIPERKPERPLDRIPEEATRTRQEGPAEASSSPPARGIASGSVDGTAGGVAGGVRGGTPGGVVGAAGTGGPMSIGQVAQRPTVVRRVPPNYPPDARREGIEGLVVIEAVLDRSGAVEPGVKVIRSVPSLDRAAIEAVRQWRFQPARDRNGQAVRVILEIPIRFVLR